MSRTRLVYDKARKKVVPAAEYHARKRVQIMKFNGGDGYQSIIDDSWIDDRAQHREHLKRHNCTEVGNERPKWLREKVEMRKEGISFE